MPFGLTFPVYGRETRELLIAEDYCPECGGELDTGWECNSCGFDAKPEADRIDIDKHHRDNI
jgi:Zn ribbon nucleic-acid-binding protein